MTTTKESLEEIKKYLCSGNPIWDVDAVRAIMNEAIAAVEKQTPKRPTKGYVYAEWLRKKLIAKVESFTDEEQRIFLSAMERELEVCEEIDCEAVREGREPKLTKICKEIKRKVMGALWA